MKILDKILNGTFMYFGLLAILSGWFFVFFKFELFFYTTIILFSLTFISTIYSIFKSK